MFFCEFCKVFENIFDRMTVLVFFCKTWEVFQNTSFYRAPLENYLFHAQVAEFHTAYTVKNYFTGAFQVVYTRTRSSHSKAFNYLKFLKIACEEVNL